MNFYLHAHIHTTRWPWRHRVCLQVWRINDVAGNSGAPVDFSFDAKAPGWWDQNEVGPERKCQAAKHLRALACTTRICPSAPLCVGREVGLHGSATCGSPATFLT